MRCRNENSKIFLAYNPVLKILKFSWLESYSINSKLYKYEEYRVNFSWLSSTWTKMFRGDFEFFFSLKSVSNWSTGQDDWDFEFGQSIQSLFFDAIMCFVDTPMKKGRYLLYQMSWILNQNFPFRFFWIEKLTEKQLEQSLAMLRKSCSDPSGVDIGNI